MKRRHSAAVLLWLATAAILGAAEPIIGTWQLDHQEFNGQKKETEPVTLRVTPEGDKLSFAFAVPVNNIDFVSMSYSAKLDGTEAEVKNSKGVKVGTVQLKASGPSKYTVILKGENRPDTTAHLRVSTDGNTLTSEADHLVQTFRRH